MVDIRISVNLPNTDNNVNQHLSCEMGYSFSLLLQICWRNYCAASWFSVKFNSSLLHNIGVCVVSFSLFLASYIEVKDRTRGK